MVRATGLPVIADIKRGDIAKTAEMYAKAHFTGDFEADIITLVPYMGLDSISPYLPYCKEPVSYTHLDVYKRQIHRWPDV